MNIEIIKVKNEAELAICSKLRKEVFGEEENGPESLYVIDEYDKKGDTQNYLLKVDYDYVATARYIKVDSTTIKLQRLVVPKKYRKNGYAKKILDYLEEDAHALGYRKIIMDSALKAVGFYEKSDYKKVSDIFYEDNRPHITMEKNI